MVGKWGEDSKFEISKNLIFNLVDSLEKANPKIQFGLRVFGHQFPKSLDNCEDSKLEIPFAAKNAQKIKTMLDGVKPQGQTPIAYSIFQSAFDFPDDGKSQNAIIIVTDGIETCDGDPCAASLVLQQKRISLKPFIIGLNPAEIEAGYFDCVGSYFGVETQPAFNNTLNTIMSQALNTTSLQINLLDINNKATETNVSMTLSDAYSREVIYNFIHTLRADGTPDTLHIDPVGKYDLTVHTIPPRFKNDFELTPGTHNIISVPAPQGSLSLKIEKDNTQQSVQCIIREAYSPNILYVQDVNSDQKYIVGDYDLEILTLPRIIKRSIPIKQSEVNEIIIEKAGTLSITPDQTYIASICIKVVDQFETIYEWKELKEKVTLSLQPGEYYCVYRQNKFKRSDFTHTRTFTIKSGVITNLKL